MRCLKGTSVIEWASGNTLELYRMRVLAVE